jgi:replicative DNA helicase
MKYELPGAKHLSEVLKETKESIEARRKKNTKILRSRWPVFDRSFGGGLEIGTNLIIGARSGQGKSAFASILVNDILECNDNPNLVILNFNWEMTNEAQGMRFLSNKLGKSVSDLKSSKFRWDDPSTLKYKLEESVLPRIDSIIAKHESYPMYFFDVSKRVREIYDIIDRVKFLNPEAHIVNVFDHTRLVTRKDNCII